MASSQPPNSSRGSRDNPSSSYERFVEQETDVDVLFGRGNSVNRTDGNAFYRDLVKSRAAEYASCSEKDGKQKITREIINAIAKRGGRFLRRARILRQDNNTIERLGWEIVDEPTVIRKVKQTLRDNASGLRTAAAEAMERAPPALPGQSRLQYTSGMPLSTNLDLTTRLRAGEMVTGDEFSSAQSVGDLSYLQNQRLAEIHYQQELQQASLMNRQRALLAAHLQQGHQQQPQLPQETFARYSQTQDIRFPTDAAAFLFQHDDRIQYAAFLELQRERELAQRLQMLRQQQLLDQQQGHQGMFDLPSTSVNRQHLPGTDSSQLMGLGTSQDFPLNIQALLASESPSDSTAGGAFLPFAAQGAPLLGYQHQQLSIDPSIPPAMHPQDVEAVAIVRQHQLVPERTSGTLSSVAQGIEERKRPVPSQLLQPPVDDERPARKARKKPPPGSYK